MAFTIVVVVAFFLLRQTITAVSRPNEVTSFIITLHYNTAPFIRIADKCTFGEPCSFIEEVNVVDLHSSLHIIRKVANFLCAIAFNMDSLCVSRSIEIALNDISYADNGNQVSYVSSLTFSELSMHQTLFYKSDDWLHSPHYHLHLSFRPSYVDTIMVKLNSSYRLRYWLQSLIKTGDIEYLLQLKILS